MNIKVQRWESILNEKNEIIPYLQGTGDKHDDDEKRRMFFKSMPSSWQNAFTSNGNNDISTASHSSIVKFMKQQEAIAKTKAAVNRAKQVDKTDSQKRKSEDKNHDKSGMSKKKRRQMEKEKHRVNREKSSNKGGNEGKCARCRHDHLWENCLCNPKNPKNILGKLAAKSGSNNNSNDRHMHHVSDENGSRETGFSSDENSSKNKKSKSNQKKRMSFLTDITNTEVHHIDCLSMETAQANEIIHANATQPLIASREHICCSP